MSENTGPLLRVVGHGVSLLLDAIITIMPAMEVTAHGPATARRAPDGPLQVQVFLRRCATPESVGVKAKGTERRLPTAVASGCNADFDVHQYHDWCRGLA